MTSAPTISGTVYSLLRLGRHPVVVRGRAMSLLVGAALGALELPGIHVGPPTAEKLAQQKQDREQAESLAITGNLLILHGHPDTAVYVCEEALRLNPDSVEALKNLGCALTKQRKVEEAVTVLEGAVCLAPDNEDAHFLLANVIRDQGHLQWAAVHYEETLRINPDNSEAQNKLAAAHYHFGLEQEKDTAPGFHSDAEAIREYKKAIYVQPACLPAYDRLLPLLLRYDRRHEAAQLERQRRAVVLRLTEQQETSGNITKPPVVGQVQ